MKKLPIGIQTFESIVTENYVYIDKTKDIYNLVTTGKYIFMSRPRRFGKSLLCSTLKSLLEGRKDLFKGLWIEKSNWNWKKHPVIHIPLASVSHRSPDLLEASLSRLMDDYIKLYNLDVDKNQPSGEKLMRITKELAQTNKVAIIIDEYDYPLVSNIHKPKLAKEIREVLKDFYTVLKDLDPYVTFVFITGVSKFSKTSIFSGLNNLLDITLHENYATLTGITDKEIETDLDAWINNAATYQKQNYQSIRKETKAWYDGYLFSETATKHVYNPFSLFNFLEEKKFKNYWFATGTPEFLMNLIEKKAYPIENLDNIMVKEAELGSFNVDTIRLHTLFFQTGYLTIKGYDANTRQYKLGFPNYEVKYSFLYHLIEHMTSCSQSDAQNYVDRLSQALASHDLDEFFKWLKIFFANIPYTLHISLERYYQSIFFVILKLMNADIIVEQPTNVGRIDIVYTTHDRIYIIEWKINDSPKNAIRQIEEKKYYEKFLDTGKQIVLLGINFETKKKNLFPEPLVKIL